MAAETDQKIGHVGGIIAACVFALAVVAYIIHTALETSRWAREWLLGFSDLFAATFSIVLSVADILGGTVCAVMAWALWRLYGHHVRTALRPIFNSLLEHAARNRGAYSIAASRLLIVCAPLGIGLIAYNADWSSQYRGIKDSGLESSAPASHAGESSRPKDAASNSNAEHAPLASRWVVMGRPILVGPSGFVQIAEATSPFADPVTPESKQAIAENVCDLQETFTSEELAACSRELRKHPPKSGIGGPRLWFAHRVNGRLIVEAVTKPPPLPKRRPPMPIDLTPPGIN